MIFPGETLLQTERVPTPQGKESITVSSFVNQWFIMVIYTITGDVKAAAPLNPTSANCFPFYVTVEERLVSPLRLPPLRRKW